MIGIDKLRFWFFDNGLPYYTVYNGNPTSKNQARAVATTNTEIDDVDQAWEKLESFLMLYPQGSTFKIFAKKEPLATTGAHTILKIIGQTQNVAGISGHAGQGMMGMYGHPGVGFMPVAEVEQKIQSALKEERLNTKLENLQAQIDSPSSTFEKCVSTINDLGLDVNGLLTVVLMKLGVIPAMQQPTPAMNGVPAAPTTENVDTAVPHETVVEDLETESEHPIDNAINRMMAQLGEAETIEALGKMASFVEKSPEYAKTLLNGL